MKPMLACSKIPQISKLRLPIIASPKLDGIRCLAIEGKAYSRTMKLIPNAHVQAEFARLKLDGLDGELMVQGDFNSVQSAIMSMDGKPNFSYHVFDNFAYQDEPFRARITWLIDSPMVQNAECIRLVPQRLLESIEDVTKYFSECITKGFEGLILRDPNGPYKQGRSTMRQGWMLKLKSFNDAEATVIDFEELLRNTDTSCRRAENMVAADTLGALWVEWSGQLFSIGSGFTEAQRKQIWENRDKYKGATVTFKYQEISRYGVPRFPVYKGFRSKEDIGK